MPRFMPTKKKKSTKFVRMTAEELEAARLKMKLDQTAMSLLLETPYTTYQDWEAGRSRIPGAAKVAANLLTQRDQWLTADIIQRVTDKYVEAQLRREVRLAKVR